MAVKKRRARKPSREELARGINPPEWKPMRYGDPPRPEPPGGWKTFDEILLALQGACDELAKYEEQRLKEVRRRRTRRRR